MRTQVCELKCTYDEMYYCYTYIPGTRYIVPGTYICRGGLAVAPDADQPTRTLILTRTRTLWGDLCWDAVGCEVLG